MKTRKILEKELEEFERGLVSDIGKVQHVHHVLYQGIAMRLNNLDPGWTKVFFRNYRNGGKIASTHLKLDGDYSQEIERAREWFERAYPNYKTSYILTHD